MKPMNYVMNSGNEMVGQRQHERYQVPSDSFVATGSHDPIVDQIIDFSLGGVAFRYMDSKKPADESSLDIYFTHGNLCLSKIPFRAVSDHEILNTVLCKTVDPLPPSCSTMRQGSGEFGDLTSHQRCRLEYCIQNHMIGAVI